MHDARREKAPAEVFRKALPARLMIDNLIETAMKNLTLVLSLSLSFSVVADDHAAANSYVVESVPFSLKDGKTIDDMMALQDDFAAAV